MGYFSTRGSESLSDREETEKNYKTSLGKFKETRR
jgi:hypothetical protein